MVGLRNKKKNNKKKNSPKIYKLIKSKKNIIKVLQKLK